MTDTLTHFEMNDLHYPLKLSLEDTVCIHGTDVKPFLALTKYENMDACPCYSIWYTRLICFKGFDVTKKSPVWTRASCLLSITPCWLSAW